MRVRLHAALIASLVATASPAAAAGRAAARGQPERPPEPLTLEGSAFGRSLHVEVSAAPGAEKALIAALRAIQTAQAESDLASGPLADLNRGAGGGARRVDAKLLGTLARASTFCRWSEGSFGPLGGPLNEVWGLRVPRPSLPTAKGLEEATAAAACDRLSVDVAHGTATLAAGARIDLWSFEAGAALDRAVEVLAAGGVRNASLTLGNVQRAVGAGPEGKGWPLLVAVPPALAMFTGGLTLHDQSFALASRGDGELRAGGERYAPYLDHHTGRPVTGVLATVAISQLALDAQGLAAALFVIGNRRGGMLLGALQPPPAALWMLGDGNGEPLVSDYRWGGRQRRGGR